MSESLMEEWECGDCGITAMGRVDKIIGKRIQIEVGEGRRSRAVETVVCPNCHSDRWHSESVRDAFMGVIQ